MAASTANDVANLYGVAITARSFRGRDDSAWSFVVTARGFEQLDWIARWGPRAGPVYQQLRWTGHRGSGHLRGAGARPSRQGRRPGSRRDSFPPVWEACRQAARARLGG